MIPNDALIQNSPASSPSGEVDGTFYRENEPLIRRLLRTAWQLHADTNQTYGDGLPYGFHLELTGSYVTRYGHLVAHTREDLLTLYGGAYFHDVIEDARVTYNDLVKLLTALNAEQPDAPLNVHAIAEAVFALTNNRGRNRHERADAAYYAGIRQTPFASFLKMCDRLANLQYSCLFGVRTPMCHVYEAEMPDFLSAISDNAVTPVPQEMVDEAWRLLGEGIDLR